MGKDGPYLSEEILYTNFSLCKGEDGWECEVVGIKETEALLLLKDDNVRALAILGFNECDLGCGV